MSAIVDSAAVAPNDSMNDSVTSISSNTSSQSQNRFITEPILYKTKMCRNFMRDGYCYYETKCMFAHGTFDVRAVDQNVKEGLTSEERVKRFQTRSIIMLKQKTRKEQPPSFQDAVVQVVENDKPRFDSAMSPTAPPTQCASNNCEQPPTPPTMFSPAPAETSSSKPKQQTYTENSDSIIDIIADEPENYKPAHQEIAPHHQVVNMVTKYGYGSEPPSLNGSMSAMSANSSYSGYGPYTAPFSAPYPSTYGYDYGTGYPAPQVGYAGTPQPLYPASQASGYCECASCHEAQRSMSQSLSMSVTDDTLPSPVYYSTTEV